MKWFEIYLLNIEDSAKVKNHTYIADSVTPGNIEDMFAFMKWFVTDCLSLAIYEDEWYIRQF